MAHSGHAVTSLRRVPRHLWLALKAIVIFRQPVAFLRHYAKRDWPVGEPVRLRSGLEIALSDPGDIVTLVEIFLRRPYGRIRRGAAIIDIGANIGAFSMFALSQGASQVFAFEPSARAFEVLERNIQLNSAKGRVHSERTAVSGRADEMVQFPVASSRENAMITGHTNVEVMMTPTTTLQSILDEHDLQSIDLLKLDCEGAERAILLETPDSVWPRIRNLRLEFHYEGDTLLRPFLTGKGFNLVKHVRTGGAGDGIMWFEQGRPSSPTAPATSVH